MARQSRYGLRVVSALAISVAALTADLRGQDTLAYYRFEEGAGFDVTDDASGDVHGQVLAGAEFSTNTATLVGGPVNNFCMDFTGGGSLTMDTDDLADAIPFLFHSVDVGGVEGDATLEFLFMPQGPTPPNHSALFWTQIGSANLDLVHIFWDAFFLDLPSEPVVGADHVGNGPRVLFFNGDFRADLPKLDLDEWHSMAIVRTMITAGADGLDNDYQWETYYDGVLDDNLTVETHDTNEVIRPDSAWTINGRAGFGFLGFMDEIRISEGAVAPADQIRIDRCVASEPGTEVTCDDGNDNDCDGLTDDADDDCEPPGVGPFIRGDCDGNGRFGGTPTEAIVGLTFTFRGGTEPPCQAACDAEANGVLAITDYVRILRSAFLGQGEPDAPFPNCTTSDLPGDVALGCATVTVCP